LSVVFGIAIVLIVIRITVLIAVRITVLVTILIAVLVTILIAILVAILIAILVAILVAVLVTVLVAVLVAALCGLIRAAGGFDALLYAIRKVFKGKKGGQIGIGMLVGLMDIATANNTVAIVIANPIAKQMSEDYDITPERTACLLDTFSCIMQGIIPYGAQILVAIAAVKEMGYQISAFEIIPNLFYPFLLLICSLFAIMMGKNNK
jgi:Na+/H+ antiporter NhaC